ncbi:histamine H2 receptor-like [Patiria miniata]|uniref:G-protein coupled receptors family 1 profile domain-containing protein n=1 Tax=Patiria miniata TaxID=46514 RepID=A0A913ZWS3_PATMI|nr:histamine H2 receptor-like [Patiria miniata]
MECTHNETDTMLPDDDDDRLSPVVIALRTAYIALNSLAIILANALTLAVMWRARGEFPPGSTKLVMSSLALSDLAVGVLSISCVPLSAMDRWPFGDTVCTLMCSVLVLFGGISIGNLLSLTLDRFVAITRPFSYPTLMSRNRVLCMTWFQWIILTVLTVIIMVTVRPRVRYNRAAAMCLIQQGQEALALDINYLCLSFILPIAAMLGIYIKLIHTTRQQAKKINTVNTASSTGGSSRAKAGSGKAVRLFCVVVIVYTICYLPFSAVRVYADLHPLARLPPAVDFVCAWLIVSNSFWNFVIYVVMNGTFRQLSKQILLEIFKR